MIMNNLFFFPLILLFFLAGCAEKRDFKIEGKIEDGGKEKIFLYRIDLHGDVIIDSLKMKNGVFKFKMNTLEEPTFFKLQLTPKNFITLLGDSTEQIRIYATKNTFSSQYTVENSNGSSLVKLLSNKIRDLRFKSDSISNLYASLSDREKAANLDNIVKEMNTEIESYKKFIGDFVFSNPRTFASYYALFLTFSDNTPVLNIWDKKEQSYFAAIATSLNLQYPDSERVKHLYNMVLSVIKEQRFNIQLEKLISEATESIPDITERDVNGNEIALSSLRGKIVLLSFWASWDEASSSENAYLKEIYSKYRMKGFEIYQVGLERSAVLWENDNWHVVEPREIGVLDRIGGGDSFVGGMLYSIIKGWEPEKWCQFAWASGALTVTLMTDYANPADEDMIWSIWKGNARVQR